jgi:hypothetical protein
MRNAETQPKHVVLVVPTTWRNDGSIRRVVMGIVPIAGAAGAPVLSLMNKISGNMSTQKKQTTRVVTDTRVVTEIGAKIIIDVNTRRGVEAAIDVVVGIETEKEGLVVGIHKTEVEAQDGTAVVIGKVIVEYIHRIVIVQ